jgi:hypothetical protein
MGMKFFGLGVARSCRGDKFCSFCLQLQNCLTYQRVGSCHRGLAFFIAELHELHLALHRVPDVTFELHFFDGAIRSLEQLRA